VAVPTSGPVYRLRILVLLALALVVLAVDVVSASGRAHAVPWLVVGAVLLVGLGAALEAGAIRGRLNELERRALRDPLTGLLNRSAFLEKLDDALGADDDRVLALVYLDLDGFKAVNDLRGHQTGDRLLVLAATRIGNCLRDRDLASRVGGDEFAVLLDQLDDERQADDIANRLLEALALPFVIDASEVRVRASIGVAIADRGVDAADELMDSADTAMYASKSAGRNRVSWFEPGMLASRRARLELEVALHRAVEDDLVRIGFQPLVDLINGEVVGFEALARWTDDDLGVVDPADFIAAAESTGLIRTLGVQLLERAHAGGRQLVSAAGRPLSLSVNLSADQVVDIELATRIHELRTLDPDVHVVLELTESVLLQDDEATRSSLEELKSCGVLLAIDDFGMGFSSFAYLDRLPVDIVKIDRSFVSKLPEERPTSLVRGIVAMAHSMGLSVVGEGIERPSDVTTLRDLGCTTGQGYLFGRALDLPTALALVTGGPIDLADDDDLGTVAVRAV
jgi:diguanylate cyclase (GGDEF)-like protein